MKITSKDDLKTYVLRRLGHPVIKINVEESQLQDRLDDALEFYQLYSDEAQKTSYSKHIISQQEITNKQIVMDDDVISVSNVYPTLPFNPSWMSPEYQNFIRELKDIQSGVIDSYYITERHLSLLNFMLVKTTPSFNFNESTKSLNITMDWKSLIPGSSFLLIETVSRIDPNQYPNLWNSFWIKELAYYYVLRQWATNLKKYSNVPLPGGITLNAQEMLDESTAKIVEVEDKMKVITDSMPFFQVA